MPVLYLVGTPIGNLEDISLRAVRILGEVSLIAAEDTRVSGKLLKRYQIDTPMLSYHEHNEHARIREILNQLERGDVALISDAGMPGLSDPGFRLVQAGIEAGVRIVPIPGPSAAISALIVSGLPVDKYLYLGFLPRQRNARQNALSDLVNTPYTLLLYESPHRLLSLLEDIKVVLGDRQLCVCRELTKLHEEVWRGTASAAIGYFGAKKVRGELTLVIAGTVLSEQLWDETAVRSALEEELAKGMGRKEAAILVSERSGWRKKEIYNLK